MLEILFDTLNRQAFFHEGFPDDGICPAADPALLPLLGVDLPNPPSIPVARRPDENFRMQIAEQDLSVFRGPSNLS